MVRGKTTYGSKTDKRTLTISLHVEISQATENFRVFFIGKVVNAKNSKICHESKNLDGYSNRLYGSKGSLATNRTNIV